MKLLGAVASPYVTRVLMFARLKDIELALENVPGGTPSSDEYRAFTPIGKIPTLDVDGRCLAESEVICEYLEEKYPEKSGFPADPFDRATSRLISRITDLYIAPHTSTMFRHMNPATRDADVVKQGVADFEKGFAYVEYFMGAGPFCAGDAPSLGDCALGPYVMLLKKTVFAAFSEVVDPTTSGRLGEWWSAVNDNADCKYWLDEYATAVDGFMKAMGARITGQKPAA